MYKVTSCKAAPDYTLWLRFDDGLEGSVYLGSLLDIGTFKHWRNMRLFLTARVDPESHDVVWGWPAGIRLDPEILWKDISIRDGWRRPRPSVKKLKKNLAFERFMVRVLEPLPPRRPRKRR